MNMNLGGASDEDAVNEMAARVEGLEPEMNPETGEFSKAAAGRALPASGTGDLFAEMSSEEATESDPVDTSKADGPRIPVTGKVVFGTDDGLFTSGSGSLEDASGDVSNFEFSDLRKRGPNREQGALFDFARSAIIDGDEVTVHGLVQVDRDKWGRQGFFGVGLAVPEGVSIDIGDLRAQAKDFFDETLAVREADGMKAAAKAALQEDSDSKPVPVDRAVPESPAADTEAPAQPADNADKAAPDKGKPATKSSDVEALSKKTKPSPLQPDGWDVKQMREGAPVKVDNEKPSGVAMPGSLEPHQGLTRPDGGEAPDAASHMDFVRKHIPKRPSRWPGFMSWPNERDVLMLARRRAGQQEIEEYFALAAGRVPIMMARADHIDKWIRDAAPKGLGSKKWTRRRHRVLFWRNKWESEALKDDTFKGVRWAILLNPDCQVKASEVIRWGHYRLETADGGRLNVRDNHNIELHGDPTEQAVTMMIREGRARGWETIHLKGNAKFAKMAREVAQREGVNAQITTARGPLGIFQSESPSMPVPPAHEAEPLEAGGADGPAGPSEDANKNADQDGTTISFDAPVGAAPVPASPEDAGGGEPKNKATDPFGAKPAADDGDANKKADPFDPAANQKASPGEPENYEGSSLL